MWMRGSLAFPGKLKVWTMAVALLPLLAGAPGAHAQGPGKAMPLGVAASGVVQKILVADGAHVEAGQVLLQLDCRVLEAEIRVRAANRAAAQAAYERARNGTRPDEIAIGQANVGVALARAQEAEAAYGRLTALTEGVTVTRAQILQDQRDARVTAACWSPARAPKTSPKRSPGATPRRPASTKRRRSSTNVRCGRRRRASSRWSPRPASSSAPPSPRCWRG
jgi:pyruvate/2-oxoglutarate dehydrogenase complex dihydrolipoamide acyltransferase (E2) component